MNKVITAILFLLLALPIKAQEEFVVRGFLKDTSHHYFYPSVNFQRSMFYYFQGNFVTPTDRDRRVFFHTFRVDSVISGSFYFFDNEIQKTPFSITLALINEAVVLYSRAYYTLQIRRFPYTNFFYVDNLSQISPNEKILNRLAERSERHQRNIDILTNGTLSERREILGWLPRDFRYIPYILPYMTSKDSVRYNEYSMCCCSFGEWIREGVSLYSDILYRNLNRISVFSLPDRATTDSIGWHKWYESLLSEKNRFPYIEYAVSQSQIIANSARSFWIDTSNRTIHFREDGYRSDIYTLNVDTDELTGKPMQRCSMDSPKNTNYSIQNNEMARFTGRGLADARSRGIGLWQLNNGIFCQINWSNPIQLSLRYDHWLGEHTFPHLIVHIGDDFFVFSSQNPNYYNRLKAGKINRNGEWVIEPKILYKKDFAISWAGPPDINAFSFYQSNKNATTLVFTDRTHGRSSETANESTGAVIVYRVNENLEITNSVVLTMEFPHRNYRFFRTKLLKNNNIYLLLAQTYGRDANRQLFYRLLNSDLTPKTDFISLSSSFNQNWHADAITSILEVRAITTSEGFLISWNDNDVSEHITRSVLIDKSGRQSNIINISNQRVRQIFSIEFDKNTVDIFLINADRVLIRKRIDKSEFGL